MDFASTESVAVEAGISFVFTRKPGSAATDATPGPSTTTWKSICWMPAMPGA